uniref:Uncharacterized protein n=1 Tax=Ditylenchus dipsaci TaxID=166011 RepID=A0A915CX08_9BILA
MLLPHSCGHLVQSLPPKSHCSLYCCKASEKISSLMNDSSKASVAAEMKSIKDETSENIDVSNSGVKMDQKPVDLALRPPFKQEISSHGAMSNSNVVIEKTAFNAVPQALDNSSGVAGRGFRGNRRPFSSYSSSRGRGFYQQNRGNYQAPIGNFGKNSNMGSSDHQHPNHYQQHQQQLYAPQFHPMAYQQNFNIANPAAAFGSSACGARQCKLSQTDPIQYDQQVIQKRWKYAWRHLLW